MRAACLLLILASARSRDSLETILARIDPPTFPPRDFYVHHYGAVPDGSTDALEGFRLAIAAARDAGGGRVVAKGGTFVLEGEGPDALGHGGAGIRRPAAHGAQEHGL